MADEVRPLDPALVGAQLARTTSQNPAASLLDLAGVAGGAPQWVAGAQKAGALTFDNGLVYLVKIDIANGQARPAAFPAGYLAVGPQLTGDQLAAFPAAISATNKLAATSDLGWVLVGSFPARRNVGLGPLGTGTVLPDSSYYNVFGYGIRNCTFGANMFGNTFGSVQNGHVLGATFESNTFGNDCSDVQFGSSCNYNRLGNGIQIVRAGNACTANVLASSTAYVTLGNNVKGCHIGPGCSAVTLLDGCERVELYNCGSTDFTTPFVVPAGTKDAVYRKNVLVGTGGGSGTPGTARDPYDVDTAKAIQVVDANVPFLQETDSNYYGKKILNRTHRPDRPALYECLIDRPLTAKNPDGTTNPSTWWWVRTPIV